MDWLEIGKRIRKRREHLGYTRESLAEKIDVTPKFCSDIELGVKGMSVTTLCRIANVLNLSADYILFGTQNNNEEISHIVATVNRCPKEKMKYLENIIEAFVASTEK